MAAKTQKISEPSFNGRRCVACPLASDCPVALVPARRAAEPPMPLPSPGRMLYAADTPAFALYVVRAGCLKTVTHDLDGNEHVRQFHFPGDLVGLDALGVRAYPSSAVAVTPAQVCRLTKGQLQQLSATSPEVMQQLLERTSRDLRTALALAGNYTAEQRVAAFLIEMEEELAPAQGSGFELPMTRRDMANHLRLATETVCRVLGRFADQGWLQGGSVMRILRREPMANLARAVGVSETAPRLAA